MNIEELKASLDSAESKTDEVKTYLQGLFPITVIDHITISASAVKPRKIVIYYNLMGNV